MALLHTRYVRGAALVMAVGLLGSCGFKRKPYENPITKDTQQPDKVLFDRAIAELEKNRYEVARLLLQNLMNTYDTSEYMAKAKLAYADSFYREGGAHGMAQAEAEYKDFILFYPNMEEAAEAQQKVCMIHYKEMEKPDRDPMHAIRAEDECRQLLVQFPNSKFAASTEQLLRNIQEVRGEAEYRVGSFYTNKGSYPAAANRLKDLSDQYPLYSNADDALWKLGQAYEQMGKRFRNDAGEAYAKIVREYPLSPYVDNAKKELTKLEMPIPQADRAAYDRMKYNLEHQQKGKIYTPAVGMLKGAPDTRHAATTGKPAMASVRPSVPASVPVPAGATPGTNEVGAEIVNNSNELDKRPDARMNQPAQQQAANTPAAPAGATTVPTTAAQTPAADQNAVPTNHPLTSRDAAKLAKMAKKNAKKKKKGDQQQEQPAAAPAASTMTQSGTNQ